MSGLSARDIWQIIIEPGEKKRKENLWGYQRTGERGGVDSGGGSFIPWGRGKRVARGAEKAGGKKIRGFSEALQQRGGVWAQGFGKGVFGGLC